MLSLTFGETLLTYIYLLCFLYDAKLLISIQPMVLHMPESSTVSNPKLKKKCFPTIRIWEVLIESERSEHTIVTSKIFVYVYVVCKKKNHHILLIPAFTENYRESRAKVASI